MTSLAREAPGTRELLMGNEAIARGALEAGVQFATGYPGTPSSEIVESLARVASEAGIYVEWSTNEKVATEAAAAASFAGLRAFSAMKTAGINVALDFLAHLNYSGLGKNGGGLVMVVCDDPEGHSSGDEADSRWFASSESIPLLEPDSPEEAREMTKWAFDLSEEFNGFFLVRTTTRISLSSGPVTLGKITFTGRKASFDTSQCISPYLAKLHHIDVLERLTKVAKAFEKSSFNRYQGPQNPELIIVCSGVGTRYALEAVHSLNLGKSVGLLKLGTLWPFPREFVEKHLSKTKQVLVVEEIDPFLETFIKKTAFESAMLSGDLKVYGKESGHLPRIGELRPDLVIKALATLFETEYVDREADYRQKVSDASEKLLIDRGVTWCAGCPHRASFWSIKKALQKDGRDGFLTGDIGCYTLDVFPAGDKLIKALHAMGSGVGLATGFGQLGQFGSEQPVVAVCGDSTFFHSSIPALLNAIHNKSNMALIVLDNRATAMTGFQSHPGTAFDAMGNKAPAIDMANLCQSLGCKVVITDPFDIKGTTAKLRRLLKEDKVKVLIMRRTCELVRMREEKKPPYTVWVDAEKCRGEKCGFCTRSFKCPALPWDIETEKAVINKAVCSGCGVCVDICPFGAIVKQEVS